MWESGTVTEWQPKSPVCGDGDPLLMSDAWLCIQLTVLLCEQRVSNKEKPPSLNGSLAQLCALKRDAVWGLLLEKKHSGGSQWNLCYEIPTARFNDCHRSAKIKMEKNYTCLLITKDCEVLWCLGELTPRALMVLWAWIWLTTCTTGHYFSILPWFILIILPRCL